MDVRTIFDSFDNNGFVVIENFYDKYYVDNLLAECNLIFSDDSIHKFYHDSENLNGDYRIWNASMFRQCPYINSYASEKILLEISKLYYKKYHESHYAKLFKNSHFAMANKLEFDDCKMNNSGGTWHRDNPKGMVKFILYLTECGEKNGCLQFINKSAPEHIGYPATSHKINKRYYDDDVDKILSEFGNSGTCITDITGKPGDLIIVDTRYIHRGKPIECGTRIALTNYTYKLDKY